MKVFVFTFALMFASQVFGKPQGMYMPMDQIDPFIMYSYYQNDYPEIRSAIDGPRTYALNRFLNACQPADNLASELFNLIYAAASKVSNDPNLENNIKSYLSMITYSKICPNSGLIRDLFQNSNQLVYFVAGLDTLCYNDQEKIEAAREIAEEKFGYFGEKGEEIFKNAFDVLQKEVSDNIAAIENLQHQNDDNTWGIQIVLPIAQISSAFSMFRSKTTMYQENMIMAKDIPDKCPSE